ncbi:serine hydrolase domain-containing protein [Anaeromyxobacter diazotrophicus]|uniref:Esterase n=1 Tax=Anaeromyxobacter diazotrophicus TaxID=2590199 RepID=A0A7I9VIC3_9BACT|nr:serine hydrolase [Anaeromyxobacter diazotrophicus]GEJ55870.1 esterase [Anaeromyxobacter diazotrophicus]
MTAGRLELVAEVLEQARRDGVAPALAAEVRAEGRVVHASLHGDAQLVPERRPAGPATLFDVASLTKVMATTSLAALLADAGALDLDAPARRWLPELPPDKAALTARLLLAHASGLPAWRPLHAAAAGARDVLAAAAATPLEAPPGARAVYSDLGFILLGALVERCGGAPLDEAFEARVARPLGLASTFFLRAGSTAARERCARHDFAAARRTPARGVIAGAVDDDNAFAMGGVAGHAGLFSSAADVAALGQAWLDALGGRSRWLSAAAAARFAARDPTPGSERALGWDTPSREGSSLGGRLGRGPRGALGHLGFTGCSLWLDRDRELVCALLTNHVHPAGPDRPRLKALRARFHDAVAAGLGIG